MPVSSDKVYLGQACQLVDQMILGQCSQISVFGAVEMPVR